MGRFKTDNMHKGGNKVKFFIGIILILICVGLYNRGFFTDDKKRQEIVDEATTAVSEAIDSVKSDGTKIVCIDGKKWVVNGTTSYQLGTRAAFGYLKPVPCN